jgi:O-antigen/teichoic acid export membrane protein
MAIGIALIASNIIGLFHYPAGFENSVTLIQILAIHIPIVAIDMILGIALTAKDRQVAWLVVGCIAAVFNPLMNLIAIPLTSHRFGDGAIGASIVTVATEILMMVGAIYLRPAGILDRRTISFLLRCMAASVTMVPVIALASQTPLAIKIFLGAITFAISAVVFRLVSVRTAREATQQVLRSLRERGNLSPVPTGVE